ncbi:hypothetical protein SUGI_0241410 [Cryptomeria japonica]|nr:hypothetical protein SUGI_0241410 [Cryptomeria japonica]
MEYPYMKSRLWVGEAAGVVQARVSGFAEDGEDSDGDDDDPFFLVVWVEGSVVRLLEGDVSATMFCPRRLGSDFSWVVALSVAPWCPLFFSSTTSPPLCAFPCQIGGFSARNAFLVRSSSVVGLFGVSYVVVASLSGGLDWSYVWFVSVWMPSYVPVFSFALYPLFRLFCSFNALVSMAFLCSLRALVVIP